MFAKEKERQQCRGGRLEIEQHRNGRRARHLKSRQQKDRSQDAAEQDGTEQVEPVLAVLGDRCIALAPLLAKDEGAQEQSRTEVKQTRENLGAHAREQILGEGRGGSKEGCGGETFQESSSLAR